MTLEITRIDPFDDAAIDAWWDAYAAAERADRGPQATVWTREESRTELQQASSVVDRHPYLLRNDGTIVGSASLALPAKTTLTSEPSRSACRRSIAGAGSAPRRC